MQFLWGKILITINPIADVIFTLINTDQKKLGGGTIALVQVRPISRYVGSQYRTGFACFALVCTAIEFILLKTVVRVTSP